MNNLVGAPLQNSVSNAARWSGAVVDVTTPSFGVNGDGTNESAKLQAAFDAAAALKDGAGRPMVIIPPGLTINIGAANLVLVEGIDFDMRGSKLTSTVSSGAALTIGRDGYLNADLQAHGIHINRDYGAASDNYLYAETVGVRFVNVYRPIVDVSAVEGFRRCIQFRAAFGVARQAGYCFEGHIKLGRMAGKYGLSLLNADKYDSSFGSWCNAMRFWGGDFFFVPGVHCGRVAGVIYELGLPVDQMPDDGIMMQDNVFISPVFQLGSYQGEPGFSSGGNVPAGNVGRGYAVGDYSYICTQSGTFGTTTLTSLSTTPGAEVTSGTAKFVCEGLYVRSPFIFVDCGQTMRCRDPYWETGVGPFLHFVGKRAGSGHRVTGVYLGGPVTNMNRLVGDRTGDRGTWNWGIVDYKDGWSKLNNVVEMSPQAGHTDQATGVAQKLRSDNWKRRFIKGQTYWQAPGLASRYVTTLTPQDTSDYKIGRHGIITGGAGFHQFGVLVPTDQYKRFRVTSLHKSGDVFSGLAFVAFDAALTPIDLGSASTVAPAIMADRGLLDTSSGIGIMVTGRNNWECWVAVADAVKYIHVSDWWGQAGDELDGFEIEAFPDDYATRYKPLAFHEPYSSSLEARRSDGTPTAGYFLTQGEYIINSTASGTTDSTSGWIVATAGILAPAWAATTAVVKDELRTRNNRVYAANSAFTTGGSGPSGTGSAIADGGGTWDYIAPAAVLSPVLQYRPHDPRVDLDYTPYNTVTAVLGTDTDTDGLSDNVVRDPYGTQTAISYTRSVATGRQNFNVTRSTGADNGAGEYLVFGATLANSKEYFLVVKGGASSVGISAVGLYVGLRNISLGIQTDLTATAYAPDGYISSPIGQANDGDEVILACRFTAPASNASGYGISVYSVQFTYPALPQTISAYVDTLWLIDIAAAETALGISLAGLSAGELYAIINTAFTYIPPLSLKMKDTVTGGTVLVTVESGSLVVT